MAIEIYEGRGIVYGGVYNTTGAIADENIKTDFGQVSKLEIDYDFDTLEVPNMRTSGGGNYYKRERIKSAKVNITIDEQRDVPLGIATRAGLTTVSEATVTDEQQRAFKGAFVPTTHTIKTSVAPVVTDSAGTTTYTVGDDYTVTKHGLLIPSTSSITDDSTIKIDYTKLGSVRVFEALAESAGEYTLFFDGLNDVTGKAVFIRLHRLSANLSKINWLDQAIGKLELTAEILSDPLITTSGLSAYYQVRKEAVA